MIEERGIAKKYVEDYCGLPLLFLDSRKCWQSRLT